MNTDTSTSIVFYYSFALLFVSLIFFPKDFEMPNTLNLILAMSLGLMGSLGHFFMSKAAKNAAIVGIGNAVISGASVASGGIGQGT